LKTVTGECWISNAYIKLLNC